MVLTSETWLALGALVLIGAIVVGFAFGVGKWIIWLFGTEFEVETLVYKAEEAEKSITREAT